jgi:hypothetical protein
MQLAPRTLVLGLLSLLGAVQPAPALARDWLPVTADELHMTSVPQAPGVAAVILYRQVDRDDYRFYEDVYMRVKILTDEGRKYADVEIPFVDFSESVRDLQARVIRADGSIVPFTGTVYEKRLVTAREGKLLAKTFQLPGVEAGCIVEYRYRQHYAYGWTYNSQWILSGQLFTREAKFSLFPNRTFSLRWSWPNGLPPGTAEPRYENDQVVFAVHDVPAFVTEDHMQPEDQLQARVDFIYSDDRNFETDPAVFWRKFAIDSYKVTRNFADKRAAMERALAQIVQPGDSDEQKLRKIYARAQRLRNTSYEPPRSEQETAREERLRNNNVADVWDHGVGNEWEINCLFLALVRAAGLQADPLLVSLRDQYLFDPRVMNPRQLDDSAVLVKLDGKDLYLDPGTPYTPFGMQPWNATDAHALRLTADGGVWVVTPTPAASASRLERRAVLTLAAGALEGKLTVRYSGLEASWRRLAQRNQDDAARRQFLEQQIADMIPLGSDVKLTSSPDWGASDALLVAEYDLKVPGWATPAGHRQLLSAGLFGNSERHAFEHATRVHPIYFEFPHQDQDDVVIELPAGWQAQSVPAAHSADLKTLLFTSTANSDPHALHLTRELTLNLYRATVGSYPAIQAFFQTVRTSDEEHAVVAPDASVGH